MTSFFRPLLLASLLVGCIKPTTSKDSSTDDTSDTDSGGGGGGDGTTIYDIQTGAVEEGALVTLSGVVVTSPLTADGRGFFISDPDGGEYSGLYVYLQGAFTDFQIFVDDELTLTGEVSEYYDYTELTVTSPTAIEVTGEKSGGVAPTVLGDTSGWGAEDWEPYESVLVQLDDQDVETAVNSYGEVSLSGGLKMDNLFFDFSTEFGAHYDAIIGPIAYNFSEFKVNPRDDGDLQGYTPGQGPTAKSVCEVQEAQLSGELTDQPVLLEGVIATSSFPAEGSAKGFYVQDRGGGVPCGVYVYVGSKELTVSVGDELDVEGTVTEYFDLTEVSITNSDDVVIRSSGNDTVSEGLSSAPADWEPYEGLLVTLSDVMITSDEDSYGVASTSYGSLVLDDDLYYYDVLNGQTYTAITGIITYSYEQWRLLPRSLEDMTGGSGGEEPDPNTVTEIQMGVADGSMSDGDRVRLEGVIATSDMTLDDKGFYVQDPGGGPWAGIYVYGASGAGVKVGDVLTIDGSISEYFDLTEIKVTGSSAVEVTDTGEAPTVTELTGIPSDWEPYEGLLLNIRPVSITSDEDSYGEVTTDWDISLDDQLYDYSLVAGDSFAAVTGLMSYSYSTWKLCPRGASDLVE